MNRKGQSEIQAIIGGIVSIFIIIVFVSAMIPVFQSLTGADDKQAEINKLLNENNQLKQTIQNKEVELSRLRGILNSLNTTLEEKDTIIANLSGEVTKKNEKMNELSEELNGYKEKEYLPSINNNYYNILNYVEQIENKFYTINIAIGLISITLLGVVIKMFGLDITFKFLLEKYKKRRAKKK